MVNNTQSIPCPICSTSINFDPQQLIQGFKFACNNCHATVGLTQDSIPLVASVYEKIDELKKKKQ